MVDDWEESIQVYAGRKRGSVEVVKSELVDVHVQGRIEPQGSCNPPQTFTPASVQLRVEKLGDNVHLAMPSTYRSVLEP